jgi:hypothetical protein
MAERTHENTEEPRNPEAPASIGIRIGTTQVTALLQNEPNCCSRCDRDCRANIIRCAFKAAGIEFIDENGGGPGVRLKKPRTKRT